MKNHAAMVGRIYAARQAAMRAMEKAGSLAELTRQNMTYQANDLELADMRDAIRDLTAAAEALDCAVIVLEQARKTAALPRTSAESQSYIDGEG